jgi:hypothetical protein
MNLYKNLMVLFLVTSFSVPIICSTACPERKYKLDLLDTLAVAQIYPLTWLAAIVHNANFKASLAGHPAHGLKKKMQKKFTPKIFVSHLIAADLKFLIEVARDIVEIRQDPAKAAWQYCKKKRSPGSFVADVDAVYLRELVFCGAAKIGVKFSGKNSLHWAVWYENAPMVRCLLASLANPAERSDDGITPLALALACQHEDIIKCIRQSSDVVVTHDEVLMAQLNRGGFVL